MKRTQLLVLGLLISIAGCKESTAPTSPKELDGPSLSIDFGEGYHLAEGPVFVSGGVSYEILPVSTATASFDPEPDVDLEVCPVLQPGYYLVMGNDGRTPAAILWVKSDCSTTLLTVTMQS